MCILFIERGFMFLFEYRQLINWIYIHTAAFKMRKNKLIKWIEQTMEWGTAYKPNKLKQQNIYYVTYLQEEEGDNDRARGTETISPTLDKILPRA